MIKYVLFDLDGVLVDARELHYEALNAALAKFGYTINRSEHLSTYDGLPTRRKLELLTEQKRLSPDLYDEIWQQKQAATLDIISRTYSFDERLRAVLRRLKEEGFKLAVCSMSVRESVKLMLLRKGFLEYVDFYLANDDVRHFKPNPEIFLRAMVEFGAGPKECVVVEDSHHGREAADAAGAVVCGVKNTSDVTYEKIREVVDRVQGTQTHRYVPKWQGEDLTIVIPMAGEGKSYQKAGYTFPKPLVDVRGKPMIQWVVENLNAEAKYVFVVRRDHYERFSLRHLFNLIAPRCDIVVLDQSLPGAMLSVLAARQFIDVDGPLVIANSDQVIEWNSNEFFYAMAADECAGGLVTFTSTHPQWSYVRTGDNGFVVEAAEKQPISNQATAGVYYFSSGHELVRYADQMIAARVTTRGEYYVCPVYNEYVKEYKKVRVFPVEKMWSFSTPEDLEVFLKHYPEGQGAVWSRTKFHPSRVGEKIVQEKKVRVSLPG